MGRTRMRNSRVKSRDRTFDFVEDVGANQLLVWHAGGPDFLGQAGVTDGVAVGNVLTIPWVDERVGAGLTQSTAAKQPILDLDGLNGNPCVTFDGSNDFLRGLGIAPVRDAYLTVVYQLTNSGDSSNQFVAGLVNGAGGKFGQNTSNVWTGDDGGSAFSDSNATDNNPHIAVLQLGVSGVTADELYIDGVTQGGSDTADATLGVVGLGARGDGNFNAAVKIAWVGVSQSGNDPTAEAWWTAFTEAAVLEWGVPLWTP